ncbi:DUF2768 domain-containing protein [Bacillus carboniphilus]|uniref:DUF2768 domain-containing protein n=1 Tax=Bacillus carboniphilus TaxID=86663 RepID=A0ABY9JWH1_9BACI|nr:DUF2768 domain-containing protein [Bacillus carboniphilus]WLR43747.1 DUF2768 domain-containing protein [Bacillus carboniphilus]
MSPGLLKMWISLIAMGLMFIAVFCVYLSRFKLKGIFKAVITIIGYICLIVSGIIIFFVVFSGPVNE